MGMRKRVFESRGYHSKKEANREATEMRRRNPKTFKVKVNKYKVRGVRSDRYRVTMDYAPKRRARSKRRL